MALNVCIIQGNFTHDPEVTYTQEGKAMVNFSLGHNKGKNVEGQFFRMVAFDKTAELITQYCKKGTPIIATGELSASKYTDQTSGEIKSSVKIIVRSIDFCGNSMTGAGVSNTNTQQNSFQQPPQQQYPQQRQSQKNQAGFQQQFQPQQQVANNFAQPVQQQFQQMPPMQHNRPPQQPVSAIPQQNLFDGGAQSSTSIPEADLPF